MPADVSPAVWQRRFLEAERLPASYLDTARAFFDPIAADLARRSGNRPRALLVAVNGSQGSGKSTLCAYLALALEAVHGRRAVALSLDDFYLERAERQRLARDVHPLLATRGVPGTHDTELLVSTLEALRDRREGTLAVPAFDKSWDDRYPARAWPHYAMPLDVVMLEGWCLGARAVDDAALEPPLNALERDEDPDGSWRRYCNRQLRDHYEPVYALFEHWLMLAAPSFEQVFSWRAEQEARLRERVGGCGEGLMDTAALERFVAHFERHTRNCLATLPPRADRVLQLDAERQVIACRG